MIHVGNGDISTKDIDMFVLLLLTVSYVKGKQMFKLVISKSFVGNVSDFCR